MKNPLPKEAVSLIQTLLAAGVPAKAFETDSWELSLLQATLSKMVSDSFLIPDMPSTYCQPVIIGHSLTSDEGGNITKTLGRPHGLLKIMSPELLRRQLPDTTETNAFIQPTNAGNTVSVFSVLNKIDERTLPFHELLSHFDSHDTPAHIACPEINFDALALPFHQMFQGARLALKMFYHLATQPLIGQEMIIPFKFFEKAEKEEIITHRRLLRIRSVSPRGNMAIDYVHDIFDYVIPYGASLMFANVRWWRKPKS